MPNTCVYMYINTCIVRNKHISLKTISEILNISFFMDFSLVWKYILYVKISDKWFVWLYCRLHVIQLYARILTLRARIYGSCFCRKWRSCITICKVVHYLVFKSLSALGTGCYKNKSRNKIRNTNLGNTTGT